MKVEKAESQEILSDDELLTLLFKDHIWEKLYFRNPKRAIEEFRNARHLERAGSDSRSRAKVVVRDVTTVDTYDGTDPQMWMADGSHRHCFRDGLNLRED